MVDNSGNTSCSIISCPGPEIFVQINCILTKFCPRKFGCPLLEYRAVTLPIHETRCNLLGCPKLANSSQLVLGQTSPYYEDMCRRYWCLTSFFRLSTNALVANIYGRQSCAIVPRWQFFVSCISASHVQHISDMHSKFALRLHQVTGRCTH